MDFFPLKILTAKQEYTGKHANVEIQLGDYIERLRVCLVGLLRLLLLLQKSKANQRA
jgi:hypothetical protein